MSERCGDRSSMPTRHYEPLINIAHLKILLNEVLAITDRSPLDCLGSGLWLTGLSQQLVLRLP